MPPTLVALGLPRPLVLRCSGRGASRSLRGGCSRVHSAHLRPRGRSSTVRSPTAALTPLLPAARRFPGEGTGTGVSGTTLLPPHGSFSLHGREGPARGRRQRAIAEVEMFPSRPGTASKMYSYRSDVLHEGEAGRSQSTHRSAHIVLGVRRLVTEEGPDKMRPLTRRHVPSFPA